MAAHMGVLANTNTTKVTPTSDREWELNFHNIFCGKFSNEKEEDLFQMYIRKQKIKIIPAVVFSMVIYLVCRASLAIVVLDQTFKTTLLIVYGVFIIISLSVLFVVKWHKDTSDWITTLAFVSLWVANCFVTFFDVGLRESHKFTSPGVGWLQLGIFTTFVVLPARLRYVVATTLMMAIGSCIEELLLFEYGHSGTSSDVKGSVLLPKQLGADLLLFFGAMGLGLLVFVFTDSMQRRSFLQSKKAHTVSNQLRKVYKEQERLLLSVLPKHIADEMMRDQDTDAISGQFRKIYMNRYENVSILFADIVGFTAISSSVTAAELVKILNELFASFDDLAKKFHQQRIKILGDCYYSVCGALDPRPDHAVLAIHMGMAMVDAIKAVRESTGKNVNMRVGIHTGSVLGGVLGQRQWQYDVLGKEVKLANHMESGGIPARVHISETTKALLNGEFELEPGYGGSRDEYLKQVNIPSYLIKSVIKPYPQGTLDAAGVETENSSVSVEAEADSDLDDQVEWSFHEGSLKEVLLDKSKSSDAMKEMNLCTTWFHDNEREARYRARHEGFGGASMFGLCGVLLITTGAKLAVISGTIITLVVVIISELILVIMATISSAVSIVKQGPGKQAFVQFSAFIEGNRFARILWTVSAFLVLIIADISVVMQCSIEHGSNVTIMGQTHTDLNTTAVGWRQWCSNPIYFIHVAHLILISVSSLVHIEHVTKFMIVAGATVIYAVLYMVVFAKLFDQYDKIFTKSERDVPSKYAMSMELICASFSIMVLIKKMEEISRHLFLWKEESDRQTKRVATLRHKNESLIYNILPAEVASHFVGIQKDSKDLYSHGYDYAAVMFAACPNFHDFYSESAVNNEGLECLRFLNEIISDYDDLLRRPRFQSITKIKTVGATYMAASGMVQVSELESMMMAKNIKMRWKNLDELVQFALSMKEELTKINEQSFNNFILRIGIHHGPIIAGVIGARKPHYDIWGNTVNVASRMESTGQLGRIQVVEETKQILEEFGYSFTMRGLVSVKGKGELMTYFLDGKDTGKISTFSSQSSPPPPPPSPPPPPPPPPQVPTTSNEAPAGVVVETLAEDIKSEPEAPSTVPALKVGEYSTISTMSDVAGLLEVNPLSLSLPKGEASLLTPEASSDAEFLGMNRTWMEDK